MKHIRYLPLLFIILSACTPTHPTHYTIEGCGIDSIQNGKYLYLQRYDDQKIIDSARVENQRYVFKGLIDTATYCYIDTKSWSTAEFMLEPGTIRIQTENRKSSVSGTTLNDEWNRWKTQTDSLLAAIKEQQEQCRTACSSSDIFQERWTSLYQEKFYPLCVQHFQKAMKRHPDDAFGYALLKSSSLLSLVWKDRLNLFQAAGPSIQNTRMYAYKRRLLEAAMNTQIGQRFVNLQGKDPHGKHVTLADYVGKGNYVLVDLWACWCRPCLEEMQHLQLLHQQYGNRNLTIVGIHTEDSFERFTQTIHDKKLSWRQLHDTQATAMSLYGVEGIPFTFLLSPDGIIVERDLRGEKMVQTVSKYVEGRVLPK